METAGICPDSTNSSAVPGTVPAKAPASIVVIGYQREDERMYPHLADVLKNLRASYQEVIYLDDDDRGDGLYSFDRFLHNIVSVRGARALLGKLGHHAGQLLGRREPSGEAGPTGVQSLSAAPPSFQAIARDIVATFRKLGQHLIRRRRLIEKLDHLELRYRDRILIAIDHTALSAASGRFPGKVVLWSFDIPTKDYDSNHHMRIRNGLYEKHITAPGAPGTDTLIIQDAERKALIEEALELTFPKTIYLPVSLNDSPFCRDAAATRRAKSDFSQVRIIQSGGLGRSRLSDELIDCHQGWPEHYSLTLHGVIFSNEMTELVAQAARKPELTGEMLSPDRLPAFLSGFDIGFVGYAEKNRNHDYIENASAQLVAFLMLGIPVIACGSEPFNAFINRSAAGVAVAGLEQVEAAIVRIVADYAAYSARARALFEERYDLSRIFNGQFVPALDAELKAQSSALRTAGADRGMEQ